MEHAGVWQAGPRRVLDKVPERCQLLEEVVRLYAHQTHPPCCGLYLAGLAIPTQGPNTHFPVLDLLVLRVCSSPPPPLQPVLKVLVLGTDLDLVSRATC